MKPGTRKTVAVDFDGVLHTYTTPWINPHTIPDGPVTGAIDWLLLTIQHLDIVVYSTRCRTWRGRRAVRAWLRKWAGEGLWRCVGSVRGLEEIRFSYEKPIALVYLDDRAVRFTGPTSWPSVREIKAARPWNKP